MPKKKQTAKNKKAAKRGKAAGRAKTQRELDERVSRSFDAAAGIFLRNRGYAPMLFVDYAWMRAFSRSPLVEHLDTNGFGMMLWSEEAVDARSEILEKLGVASALFEGLGITGSPVSVHIVAEAWANMNSNLRPADDPGRREILAGFGMNAKSEHAFTSMNVVRDSAGGVRLEKNDWGVEDEKKPGTSSGLLSRFWRTYEETLPVLLADRQLVHMRELAEPMSTRELFEHTLRTALGLARQNYAARRGVSGA